MTKLNELKPGDKGTVTAVSGAGSVFQRILEMGIMEGEEIEVIRTAPLGDPIEVRIGDDYNLSMRKAEAAWIEVNISVI